MKVLETRGDMSMRRRRYELDDGRRVTTMEVPAAVLRTFSQRALREAVARWQRGEETRNRQERIKALLVEGVKPTAIAHELGITEQRVRQVRKVMLSKSPNEKMTPRP